MSSLECRIALIRETERHPGDGRRMSLSSTGLRLKSIIQDSHNSSYFLMTLRGRNIKNASQKAKCFLKSPNMPNPNPHIFTATSSEHE